MSEVHTLSAIKAQRVLNPLNPNPNPNLRFRLSVIKAQRVVQKFLVVRRTQFEVLLRFWSLKEEKTDSIYTKQFSLKTPLEVTNGELNYNMKWYYGTSDYSTLTKYERTDLDETADLGWGIFGTINRNIFIPIFGWLESLISNYGLIIILMTIARGGFLYPAYRAYIDPLRFPSYKGSTPENAVRLLMGCRNPFFGQGRSK